jgi:plastocyanin
MKNAHLAGATACVVASALGLAVPSASSPNPGPNAPATRTTTTHVRDNYFRPRISSVKRGAVVRWTWRGRSRHNVWFVSGRRQPRNCGARRRGSCERTFRRVGTYDYVCSFHGSMTGRIKVL